MNDTENTHFEIIGETDEGCFTFYEIQRIGTPEQYSVTKHDDGVRLQAVINVVTSTDTPVDPDDITDLPPDVLQFIEENIDEVVAGTGVGTVSDIIREKVEEVGTPSDSE